MARRRQFYPLLTARIARSILDGKGDVSLDLGLTNASVKIEGGRVILPNGDSLDVAELRRAGKRENVVYFPRSGGLQVVALTSSHFFKLVPTGGAPTLEVDGIRMHRTKETTPDIDARSKVEALDVRRGFALDTCTGLGYTAQAAAERGAATVLSIELRREVLSIAGMNPWSRALFEDDRIHLILGDAFDVVGTLPPGLFDYAIHDPPRFALAGRLYSLEFYSKLFRTLKRKGRLYHYTGEPGSRYRGVDLRRGVMRRLGEAGFKKIEYHDNLSGVTSEKPD